MPLFHTFLPNETLRNDVIHAAESAEGKNISAFGSARNHLIRKILSRFQNSQADLVLDTKRQHYSFFPLTKPKPHNTSANIY